MHALTHAQRDAQTHTHTHTQADHKFCLQPPTTSIHEIFIQTEYLHQLSVFLQGEGDSAALKLDFKKKREKRRSSRRKSEEKNQKKKKKEV